LIAENYRNEINEMSMREPGTSDSEILIVVAAALVRSPYAHARITRVDAARASAMPGVLAVITTGDLGEIGARLFGSYTKDQPVLARGVVRFEGEPVVAVVAADAGTARAAAALVDVEYEERPCAVDVRRALAPDAALVHETPPALGRQGRWPAVPGTNVCARVVIEQGDVAAGLAEAERPTAARAATPGRPRSAPSSPIPQRHPRRVWRR
jgi:CO/xanthine dehydrogenase Mo-binding subunit